MGHFRIDRCLWRTLRSCLPLLAAAGPLVTLSACTVGPDYVRPTAETPPVFKEMSGWKRAQPMENVRRGAWWEIFGDPQLNTLEAQVNLSNQNIAAAEAQFRQALALVRVARAGYFPTVTIAASATRSGRQGGITGTSGGNTTDYALPFNATWELDLWGRVRRTVEANKASAEATGAQLEALRLSVQAELAQDYFQFRGLDAQKQLLDSSVTAFGEFLELTRNRYGAGVASMADVYQAETQLKSTQAQAIDVGVQRAQFEHAIALLIGKPASVFSLPAAPLISVPPAIPVGVPSELLERRPDIAAAERQMAAANAQIGVAEAAYYPTVTLSASAGFEAAAFSDWFSWPSHFWSLGGRAAETIFNGGLRKAQKEAAQAVYDATVASYRQTVLTGFQEVEDNLSALRILEQEVKAQEEAVKAARQSTIIATNQYKAGIVSYLNVIVAQTTQLANERVATEISSRRATASVLLVKALGGGWQASNLPPVR